MATTAFFNRSTYFIREHIGLLKLTDTFDILDAETQEHLGYATEENPAWLNWTRLLLQKHRMPTTVVVRRLADNAPVLRLERGWRWLRSKIRVYDGRHELLGYFESKILTIGGGLPRLRRAGRARGRHQGQLDRLGFSLSRCQRAGAGLGDQKMGGRRPRAVHDC